MYTANDMQSIMVYTKTTENRSKPKGHRISSIEASIILRAGTLYIIWNESSLKTKRYIQYRIL